MKKNKPPRRKVSKRLKESAPELLAALRLIVDHYEIDSFVRGDTCECEDYEVSDWCVHVVANMAIEKATGKKLK